MISKYKTIHSLSLYLFFSLALFSCKKETGRPDFEIIQDEILTPNCANSGCHSSVGDASYSQHKLLLSIGNSYDALINKAPQNATAIANGWLLVKPSEVDKSLLYHKITCETGHHSGNIGATMPLGGKVLSRGQVEFIKRWIIAGASKTSAAVDDAILKDSSACQVNIEPLTPPAAGAGFQLTIEPFEIPKNFEREVFIRKNTPNSDTVFVNRIQLRGGSNSHHFVAYSFRNELLLPAQNVLRDLRDPVTGVLNQTTLLEMQNHIFLGGGTDVNTDVTLPAGTAIRIKPNMPIDLNAHYFNLTNLILQGRNYANFYTIPRTSVQNEVKMLDLNNLDIYIPPYTRRTFTKNFTFSTTTRVVLLTSHFHKLGEKFVIKIFGGARNGEIIYTNTDWEHPLVKSFTTPIVLQPGEGLTSEVTYYNSSSVAVAFGLTSQDEMNIIFGYYY
ncbi:MAG: hypothetical protein RLZ05_554 [Bacteroidota bacterium]|jgi:hypothetical protein